VRKGILDWCCHSSLALSALTIVARPVFPVILSASKLTASPIGNRAAIERSVHLSADAIVLLRIPGEASIRINPGHSPALAPEGTA
jgi:hypothetical protein